MQSALPHNTRSAGPPDQGVGANIFFPFINKSHYLLFQLSILPVFRKECHQHNDTMFCLFALPNTGSAMGKWVAHKNEFRHLI
jgi:hypothetical protein